MGPFWGSLQVLVRRTGGFIASHRTVSAVLAATFVFVTTFSAINFDNVPKAEAAGGWASGAGGGGVANGAFASFRGKPLDIVGTWADNSGASQSQDGMCNEYKNWSGDLDLAPGGVWDGNWGNAASGGMDGQWRSAMQKVNACWGSKKTVYVRPFHEFNGNWYTWSVKAGQAAQFKQAWIRYYNIVQQELVAKGRSAKMTLSANSDPTQDANINTVWPGDQYVDVVSVDFYDQYPVLNNQSAWDSNFMSQKLGGPRGIGAWLAFAKAHGKPLGLSEWGVMANNSGDDAFFIKKMNEFFRANAGTGAGQIIFDVYFNDYVGKTQLAPDTSLPNSRNMYKSLSWGNGGGTTATGTPAPTSNPATPTATPSSPLGSNLLAGKTFTSSAGENADEPGNPPSNVNDGNTNSRWISAAEDNVWIQTDLGSSYKINQLNIIWAGDTTKNYDAQVSGDGTNWTTVKSGVTANGSQQEEANIVLSNATGRYLRIVAKDRWNDGYGNSIWEIAAYGTAVSGGNTGCSALKNPKADLNGDCRVNILDLSILLASWMP